MASEDSSAPNYALPQFEELCRETREAEVEKEHVLLSLRHYNVLHAAVTAAAKRGDQGLLELDLARRAQGTVVPETSLRSHLDVAQRKSKQPASK